MSKTEVDPEEKAEWDEYVYDVIEAIKGGYLDDHLKELGRASIERAKKVGLIKPKSKQIRTDDEPLLDTKVSSDLLVNVPPCGAGYAGDKIEFQGREYAKANFLGQRFRLQSGAYKNPKYDGMIVTITGAGQKAFKVEFPTAVGATAFETSGFIFYNKVSNLFGK